MWCPIKEINGIFILRSKHRFFIPFYSKRDYMKNSSVLCILFVALCIAMAVAGCTSSKSPASSVSPSVTAAPAAQVTPACPDTLVWDGAWDSRYLGMAGNHDLSTAWTKYKDRAYGDEASAKMTQTCWDVEGTFTDKGIKCEATFKGTIVKNTL
jgi:hypothetical protein